MYLINGLPATDIVHELLDHWGIDQLDLSRESIDRLIAAAEADLQCTIHIEPVVLPGRLCGSCHLMDDDRTYIAFYRRDLELILRRWTQCHELGHIVLRHFTDQKRRFTLKSGAILTPEEQEAEAFAAALLSIMLKGLRVPSPWRSQTSTTQESHVETRKDPRHRLILRRLGIRDERYDGGPGYDA